MGKVMRHTLGASLNIRHNLSSSKGPKPLQLKLLTTYIPKTSAFTLAFSTSQRLRTTRASARTFFDECSRLLEASTMKSRRGFAIQRLMNAMRQAHADGWFIVFDTLTLADDRLEAFYDNPNALRDYFRDIGRMVLAAEGRKANDSHADCYQYFCVPEYGTANGRLH